MSQVIGDSRRPACGHVEGTPGHHRRHVEGPTRRRGRRAYGVARSWVYELMARYRAEGEAAFEPRSRRPHTSPERHPAGDGRAGPAAAQATDRAPAWTPAPTPSTGTWPTTTSDRAVAGHDPPDPGPPRRLVTPEPRKRPKSSYIRFAGRAAQRDLAVRLHPLPAHPPRRQPRTARRRDHHLARRPLPLRPARLRPRPDHRHRSCWPPSAKPQPSTAIPHPRSPTTAWSTPSASPAAAAAATGFEHELRGSTSSRRTPDPTTPPPAARSNASSRP